MNIVEHNLKFGAMSVRKSTVRIIVHHAEATSCTAEQIHQWHRNNGWAGAGYHFLVRKDGTVHRLRPEKYVGSHAKGANSNSIGICFEGRYQSEQMGNKQIQAGRELLAYLKSKYPIQKVQRHKDVCSTDCPGKNFPFTAIVDGVNANTTTPTSTSGKTASTANSGSISAVQAWANAKVDGIFGPETKKCIVKRYQSALNEQFSAGLAVDGIFGAKTKAATVNVKKGAQGIITMCIQAALICRAYDTGGFDGIFGFKTLSAVKAFQANRGLTVDGICGKNTISALLS